LAFVESREGAGCPNLHRTVKEVNADIHSFYTVSPEGQILAVLTETELTSDLVFAFFDGRDSIWFRHADTGEERTYYIER